MSSANNTATGKSSSWRLLPVLVIASGFIAFFAFGFNDYLSFDALRENRNALLSWYHDNRLLAMVYFVAVYCLVVGLSVPGAVWLTITGGFLFGTVKATVLAALGATSGAILVFLAARYAFSEYLHKKAGSALLTRMEVGFRDDALSYLLVLRLVPLFPFWLVNLVPALLNVPLRTFVVGTFIGIIPGGLVYSSIGSGLGDILDVGGMPDPGMIFEPKILFPMIGLAVLAMIPIAYKKLKGGNHP